MGSWVSSEFSCHQGTKETTDLRIGHGFTQIFTASRSAAEDSENTEIRQNGLGHEDTRTQRVQVLVRHGSTRIYTVLGVTKRKSRIARI